MDEFYTEMRSTLDDIETSNLVSERHDSNRILQTYFPNMFAEALVPINPMRWSFYTAGSAVSSDMPELGDKINTPLENLVVVKEYLETSQSDVQWRDRVWQVAEDTTTINLSCELGKKPGSFGAGVLSNKIADGYMNEMVETSLSLNNQEKLNDRIFKQVALDQGLDTSTVRGTGVTWEFVPDFMKADLCDWPERNARPFDDDYGQSGLSDGIIVDSNKNEFGTSGDSVFESSSCTAGSNEGMCPAPIDTGYASPDSTWMKKLWDFFIPQGGGVYHCNDPSKMVPPTSFLGDMGDFCTDSD